MGGSVASAATEEVNQILSWRREEQLDKTRAANLESKYPTTSSVRVFGKAARVGNARRPTSGEYVVIRTTHSATYRTEI